MYDTNLLKSLFSMLGEGKLDREKFFNMLARAMVQETAASRGSVWLFDNDLKDGLLCESAYDASDGLWSHSMHLSEDDFADYFHTLRERPILQASDARNHPATEAFNESYLEPLNIYSLMDVSVVLDGIQLGLVRLEQTGGPRDWTTQDEQYVRQVAAMVGLVLKKLGVMVS